MSLLIINRETGNMGGINAFSFIFESNLAFPIEIIKGQATTLIASTSNFFVPDIVLEASIFKEERLNINLFEYKFSTKVAKDTYDKLQDCNLIDNNKIIALVKDNNDQVRLLGQKGNACEINMFFEKGKSVSDLNHYILEITWKSKYRAAIVPETYIIPTQIELEDGQFLELEY